MNIKNLLDNFFKETGVTRKWFAERIGIDPNFFYQVCSGSHGLPQKYWIDAVEVSLGKITLCNLIEAYLDNPDLFQVDSMRTDKCCATFKKSYKLKKDEALN